MAIMDDIETLQREGLEEISQAATTETLEECRVKWLGRKGKITEILRGLGSAAPEERRALGQAANGLKTANPEVLAGMDSWPPTRSSQ